MSKPDKNGTTAKAAEAAAVANAEAAAPSQVADSKQGVAVVLPSGEKRIDYIRRRYYIENAERGPIAKELTALAGKTVPYQIVFSATKQKTVKINGVDYTHVKIEAAPVTAPAGGSTTTQA